MPGSPVWSSQRSDDLLSQGITFLFSIALGMSTVLIPLVATTAGYSLGAVGFLVGVSAIAQIIARAGMGPMMDRFSTRTFILWALVLVALSCALLGLNDELWVFIVAQLLQGAGRAYFFTGTQTHVVRGDRSAVSALALMNVVNGAGMLVGPVVAGFIGDISLQFALFIAAGMVGVTIPACLLLRAYAPFVRPSASPGQKTRPVWRMPGVVSAGLMAGTAGGWRSILNSYLPVLVAEASRSIAMAGVMVTVANLAALAGSAAAPAARRLRIRTAASVSAVLVAAGTAIMVLLLPHIVLAGVFLAVAGLGAGFLQTLAPTIATEVVDPELRGRSLATVGTYRAVALLATPMSIGALVFVVPTAAVATAIVAVAISIPTVVFNRECPRP